MTVRAFRILFLVLVSLPAAAQPQTSLDAAELQLALNKLNVVGSALYIAAHPDDENTALLAWLANERLVRTAYLSITRGEGGQNLIGSEQGHLLGVIRTQELLAARKIDGAEQFFTRAVDSGYSKTAEETLRIWGREKILGDVVWVIRRFRPDVILSRFPSSGEGGHGQHTASAMLAEQAFHAAADPSRFSEQLTYMKPWKAKRLLWNRFQRPGAPAEFPANALAVDLGTYNPLLGRSYTEIAGNSRSMHKSQGFGAAQRRGTLVNRLQHIVGEPARTDLFEGIDLSWKRFPDGGEAGEILQRAARQFNPSKPHEIVPLLLAAHRAMSRMREEPLVGAKRQDLLEVIRAAAGLWIEAISNVSAASPGAELKVAATALNRSPIPMRLTAISSPWGNATLASGVDLTNNQPHTSELTAGVPTDTLYSHPYWLNARVSQQLVGLPENPPALPVTFTVEIDGLPLSFTVPALFRTVDPVKGELYSPFIIAPVVTVEPAKQLHIFTSARPGPVSLKVMRGAGTGPVDGIARLEMPEGWKVTPEALRFRLAESDKQVSLPFEVEPPGRESVGEVRPRVEAAVSIDRSEVVIEHDHIPRQTLFPISHLRLVRVDAARRGTRIGYVMGPGDEIPEALRQLGWDVTLLTDVDLEQGDLSIFDAVVTGVRAYNTRQALRQEQERLLEYVRNGGTLVVQYNTTGEALPERLGPYPLKISRDRVTAEDAPVTIIAAHHMLLREPNRITSSDFRGWVQERGLYFPGEWDARYETMLATADPGEPESRSGILYARYGKGIYIYTSLAFFRQLPAGVPGAYRLFANLVSARNQ